MNIINQCMLTSSQLPCVWAPLQLALRSSLCSHPQTHSESSTCWGSSAAGQIKERSCAVTKQQRPSSFPAYGAAFMRGCVSVWTLVPCAGVGENVRTGLMVWGVCSLSWWFLIGCLHPAWDKRVGSGHLNHHQYAYTRAVFFCTVFVHTSKFEEMFTVSGEDPAFSCSVNLPDNLFQSV